MFYLQKRLPMRKYLLKKMGTGREMRQFKTRKLQYLGHLIRHNASQQQLIEGNIEGKRSCGRPRDITELTNSTGAKYYQLRTAAEDKKRWHSFVVNLAQETTLRQGKAGLKIGQSSRSQLAPRYFFLGANTYI